MSHDPIAALRRETYTDTVILMIPRKTGTIRGEEIINPEGYPMTGKLKISAGNVEVKLFYKNYDGHSIDPFSYNDSYKLKK